MYEANLGCTHVLAHSIDLLALYKACQAANSNTGMLLAARVQSQLLSPNERD
jgi:hypothetical protein